ncbi:MAG: CvpA family protein [Planctomycetaceae bacterium]|nr:CvpA family protein [Planctomycetaceae bacterium]MCB9949532.1 CvpA family protein [Planctomycetaceae bacterium]
MWYDLVVLGVLAFFTIRGAMKGVIWQVAGIAGIAICFLFADGISQTVGPLIAPHVKLQEPLNHWVILFGAYLILSLISFAIARSATKWVEKAEMKEYNQHLGGILGLLKGALLVMVATFLIVTVSPDARIALKDSKTGWACAQIMYHAHPILPPKLHDAVGDYIHALDDPDLEKKYAEFGHGHDHDHEHGGDAPLFQSDAPLENQGGGSAIPWGSGSPSSTAESNSLFSSLSALAVSKLEGAVQSALPEYQPQIRTQISNLVNQLTPEQQAQLESQITQTSEDQIATLLNRWLAAFPPQPTTPAPTPPSNSGSVAGSTTNPFDFVTNNQSSGQATTPVNNTTPTAPQQLAARRQELALKIAGRVTSLPAIQNDIAKQIDGMLIQARVPDGIAINILDDWYTDVSGGTDPVPATNRNTSPQQRILYHMQAAQAANPQTGGPL